MNIDLRTTVEVPMGMEKITAELARELRKRYDDLFVWVHEGEQPPVNPLEGILKTFEDRIQDENFKPEKPLEVGQGDSEQERWFLSKWDIEYLYTLSRPLGVGCSCPFGWMEKVERIIDQQYPIFGEERFPNLYDKAAHIAYLINRNQTFPPYDGAISVFSLLLLLHRNGIKLAPQTEELKSLAATLKVLVREGEKYPEGEDKAVQILGARLRSMPTE